MGSTFLLWISNTNSSNIMKIITLESFIVTGLEVKAHWKELFEKMPKAWGELFERADEIQNAKNAFFTEVSVSAGDGFYTEMIGAEVESAAEIPSGMSQVMVPEQTYIHHRHEGPVENIAGTFGDIYDWAKEQNLTAEEFKIDRGYLPGMPETPHDLYVKISSGKE